MQRVVRSCNFSASFLPLLAGKAFQTKDRSQFSAAAEEQEGQLACWLEQLEEYDFDGVQRQGKLHTNADALSRLPHVNKESSESADCAVSAVATTSILPLLSSQDIQSEQLQDDLVGPFLQAKENNLHPPLDGGGAKWQKMVQLWNQLYVDNGVLYHLFSNSGDLNAIPQLVVPESQKERMLYGIHRGHLEIEKSVAKLKEQFYWPGHYIDVKDWCCPEDCPTTSSSFTTAMQCK